MKDRSGTLEVNRERELQLYRMQAELCQILADPTRLELLHALESGPKRVKDLMEITSQRQAKISQHLAILRQRGIVEGQRAGNEMHYALRDRRIIDACRITREILLDQLSGQAALVRAVRDEPGARAATPPQLRSDDVDDPRYSAARGREGDRP